MKPLPELRVRAAFSRVLPTRTWSAPGARWSAAVFCVALTAAAVTLHQAWVDPRSRLPGTTNHTNDPMQMTWFLRWVPWAIEHGHNPLTSNWIFYPHGVALTWNTFVPTLGILAAPVTAVFGATISFLLLMTLGPALTALTGFWWLRRHTSRPAPAALGGLIIGFNSFVAGHLLGHLNLVFQPLLPLILMLLEDLLWRHPRHDGRTATYLGIAAVAQAGISEELLLIAGVTVVIALAAAAIQVPGPTLTAVRRAAPHVGIALVIFAALAAPLLIEQLLLSRHVTLQSQRFHAVPGDFVHSLGRQVWNTANGHHSFLGGAEDGVYVGWPLLGLLLLGAGISRGDRRSRVAVVVGGVAALLALGTNGISHVWLPWRLVQHLPEFGSVLPGRFALALWLAIAFLLARWLDRTVTALFTTRTSFARPALAALALVLVPVLTLAPRPIGASAAPPHIAWFGSAQQRDRLPDGAAVLMLPLPSAGDARAMYYQQADAFRFRLIGGYALTANDASIRDADSLLAVEPRAGRVHHNGNARATIERARATVARLHPAAIIVLRDAPEADALVRLANVLSGHGPNFTGDGVSLWRL